jgi:alpha-galactosidase
MPDLRLNQIKISADSIHNVKNGRLLSGPHVTLELPSVPKLFYRHGWQSWSLATWVDPTMPAAPISSPELGAKDEDPLYTQSPRLTSAWIGAVELPGGEILLLGALDLGGRVRLDGNCLSGFYETGNGDWFLAEGTEEQVFSAYTAHLQSRFCKSKTAQSTWKERHKSIPRVWCSWYSLYAWINQTSFLTALNGLDDLPLDVIQIDDGWEQKVGDWEPNKKFPAGMEAIAEKIRGSGRIPGLWLAPFLVTLNSELACKHPEWLLMDEAGQPVRAGLSWNGITYALDSSHPDVLAWLDTLIRRIRSWGYAYLKLDFLYAGALPGRRKNGLPREVAYRQAMQVIRDAAGDAYILGCGAPIIPSIGLCDGLRVGPDVSPYWINTPMSIWLNNPAHPGAQNALRTSFHRLWLQPLLHTDPDVVYFRSRFNALTREQKSWLKDLAFLSQFKSTSDLPAWLTRTEREEARDFLDARPRIERLDRYRFHIDDRSVDFTDLIPLPNPVKFPSKLATVLGLFDMVVHEVIPALIASLRPG